MVLEERMIECRLFGDVHTVYDISIWALLIFGNQWFQQCRKKREKYKQTRKC
jgi:hypothetical protein